MRISDGSSDMCSSDLLFLAHVRPAFDPDALCLVVKFLLRPILEVGAAMIERAACPGVGDSRRLLLRRAVVAKRLVRFVVFYLRSMILRHRPSPVIGCDSNGRRQCWFDPDDNCEKQGDKDRKRVG